MLHVYSYHRCQAPWYIPFAVFKALAWMAGCLDMACTKNPHNDADELDPTVYNAILNMKLWLFLQFFQLQTWASSAEGEQRGCCHDVSMVLHVHVQCTGVL